MKKHQFTSKIQHFISALACVLCAQPLVAGELTITPEKPQRGQLIEVLYRDTDNLFNGTTPVVVLYCFEEGEVLNSARQVTLSPREGKSGEYTGKIAFRMRDSYAVAQVTDGKVTDNNKGNAWGIMLHDRSGAVAPMAYAYAGLTFLKGLPEEISRRPDMPKAHEQFKKGTTEQPDDIVSQVYLAELETAKGNLKAEQRDSLYNIWTTPYITGKTSVNNDISARELFRALRTIGKATLADSMYNAYITRTPKSILAADAAQKKIGAARQSADPKALTSAIAEYLRMYPGAQETIQMQTFAAAFALQNKDTATAAQFLQSLQQPVAEAYYYALYYAMQLDSTAKDPRLVEYAEKAMKLAKSPIPGSKPVVSADVYRTQALKQVYQAVAEMYSKLLDTNTKATELTALYRDVLSSLNDKPSTDFLQRAVAHLERQKLFAEALDATAKAIVYNISDSLLSAQHKRLYSAVMKTEKQYAEKVSLLKKQGDSIRRRALFAESLRLPAIEGTFTDSAGKPISLSDLKGKVVVIDYWATWCGPCKASFPALDAVWAEYKNDPEVIFLVVNVWERDENRITKVQDFLSKNPYTFPVLFDLKDEVIGKFGVSGIPTKFYLDKNGNIQFKEVGFNRDEDDFKKKMRDKIEFLKTTSL